MTAAERIHALIGRARWKARRGMLIEGLLLGTAWGIGMPALAGAADFWVGLPGGVRTVGLGAWGIGLLLIAGWTAWQARRSLPDEAVALALQKTAPALSTSPGTSDELVNAVQLIRQITREKDRISEDLVMAHVESVAARLGPLDDGVLVNRSRTRRLGSAAAAAAMAAALLVLIPPHPLYSALPRFLNPMDEAALARALRVRPGHVRLVRGTPLTIEIALLNQTGGKPDLTVRYLDGEWRNAALDTAETGRAFLHRMEQVTEPFEYRVGWRDLETPPYRVSVVDRPEVSGMTSRILPPAYTGLPEQDVEGGAVEGLIGTRVRIALEATKPLRRADLRFSDARRAPLIADGRLARGEFVITGDAAYQVELLDEDGYVNSEPARHQVRALADAPPTITMLAPAADLVVSERATVRLVYEARDDFGLGQVAVAWQKPGRPLETVSVAMFRPSIPQTTGEHAWPLSSLDVRSGDTVTFWLQATDNDIVSGPKIGRSQSYTLEVVGFQEEHDRVEADLKKVHEDLVNLLGDEIEVHKQLQSLEKALAAGATLPFSPPAIQQKQAAARQAGEDLLKRLDQAVKRLETDPLAEYQTLSEFRSVHENLTQTVKGPISTAEKTLAGMPAWQPSQPDTAAAAQSVADAVADLERMSVLTEDVLQQQAMRDALATSEDLRNVADRLREDIQKAKVAPNAEKQKRLRDALARLGEKMARLADQLTKSQKDLPEEFINQEAIKSIDLTPMSNTANALDQALERGDLDAAIREAEKLAGDLDRVMNTMQKAAGEVPYGKEMAGMEERATRLSLELQALASEESDLIRETAPLEQKRRAAQLAEQERLLKALAAKQRLAREIAQKAYQVITPPLIPPPGVWTARGDLEQSFPMMNQVEGELSTGQVLKSREWLGQILTRLESARAPVDGAKARWERLSLNLAASATSELEGAPPATVEPSFEQSVSVSTGLAASQSLEKDILDAISRDPWKDEPGRGLSSAEKQSAADLAKKQSALRNRTRKARQEIGDLARQSAGIPSAIMSDLESASRAMGDAESALSRSDTGAGLAQERTALSHLSKGQEGLSSAAQGLKQMRSQMGKPVAEFVQPKTSQHGPGGRIGVRLGRVRIPGPEEYAPPKAFRQELLEGLKEKRPEPYKDKIGDYYKRLTE